MALPPGHRKGVVSRDGTRVSRSCNTRPAHRPVRARRAGFVFSAPLSAARCTMCDVPGAAVSLAATDGAARTCDPLRGQRLSALLAVCLGLTCTSSRPSASCSRPTQIRSRCRGWSCTCFLGRPPCVRCNAPGKDDRSGCRGSTARYAAPDN